jgi:hypothetical protein
MKIVLRKTVRRMVMLLVAISTFIVGFLAFYFYAEAASFLFKSKQSTPETTPTLTTQMAAPSILPRSFAFSTPEYQAASSEQPACPNCIQDELCGLCEPLTGEYENYDYSFALTIPGELLAMKAPAPAKDYGFIARLSSDSQATIEVEGSANEVSWGSLNEAANAHIDYLKASAKDVTVLKRNPARLGKRPAIRYVVQYTNISTGLLMIEDKTIAIRKDVEEKQYWVIYAVSLETPALRYSGNIAALEKVLRLWKETETQGC